MPAKPSSRRRTRGSQPEKPNQKRSKGTPKDPLKCLNPDIVNHLFGLLSASDVVRCERVSWTWQASAQEWMATFGMRVHFPHSRNQDPVDATPDVFKQHARLLSSIQSGKPASVYRVPHSSKLVYAGDHVAWTVNSGQTLASWSTTSDSIYWQCLARAEDGSIGKPIFLPSTRLFRPPGCPVNVANMAINHDGVILLQLHDNSHNTRHPMGRNVVYSPVERKVLWRRDYKHCSREPEISPIPLLIGKQRLYCVITQQGGYKFAAYDFQQDKLLYDSGSFLSRHWTTTTEYYDGDRRLYQLRDRHFRLFSHESDEFILELHSVLEDSSKVSIINGANGHLVQTIDFPEVQLDCVIKQPVTNCIAVVSEPKLSSNTHSYLETHRVILIRRFSVTAGGFLTQSSADVLFAPLQNLPGPHGSYKPYLAAHPFGFGVLSSFRQKVSPDYPPWDVRGHPLVPTTDEGYRRAANAIVESVCQSNPPPVCQCLVVQKGNIMTLPARPEIGRHERVNFVLPKSFETWEMGFLDGGRALVKHGGSYIISF